MAYNIDEASNKVMRRANSNEAYRMAKYCVKMRERMNTVRCTEDDWAQCDEDYCIRLNLIARPLIPTYLEAKSDSTSDEEPDLDGDIDMSHAD